MAIRPKKSDSMQTWGAGSSSMWKSGKKAKVSNPDGNKLMPVKPVKKAAKPKKMKKVK